MIVKVFHMFFFLPNYILNVKIMLEIKIAKFYSKIPEKKIEILLK